MDRLNFSMHPPRSGYRNRDLQKSKCVLKRSGASFFDGAFFTIDSRFLFGSDDDGGYLAIT